MVLNPTDQPRRAAAPGQVVAPREAAEVESVLRWAVAGDQKLEIVGGGSKRGVGRPVQTDLTLDLSGLSGVSLYEPEELVLSAQAGTPLAEIEALLAAKNQELAFEPMDYGPIFGLTPGQATLGGVLAANVSGPRRIKAGAARDHFLGVAAVSGRGESFKSGGRVVKNVTGYDLCKLLAGSWGTLAAMTAVTVKVTPRADAEETLLLLGLDEGAAAQAMNAALGSAGDVSGAAHLPQMAVAGLGVAALSRAGRAITALRLEGVPPSIAHRREMLKSMLAPFGETSVLAETESRALWRAVRDVVPFASRAGDLLPLWRISTPPLSGPELAAQLRERMDVDVLYDWAGGLVWAQCALRDDAGAELVREAVARVGGHATLVRGSAAVRAAAPVFPVEEAGLAALTRRVKESFDPKAVLNPGRMYAGV